MDSPLIRKLNSGLGGTLGVKLLPSSDPKAAPEEDFLLGSGGAQGRGGMGGGVSSDVVLMEEGGVVGG